jgi:hypothetical protein
VTLLDRFLEARRAWLLTLDSWARQRLLRTYPGVPVEHLPRRQLWLAVWDSIRPSAEAVAQWEAAVAAEVERRSRGRARLSYPRVTLRR